MRLFLYKDKKDWLKNKPNDVWEYQLFLIIAIVSWIVLVGIPFATWIGIVSFSNPAWLCLTEIAILVVASIFTKFAIDRNNEIAANRNVYENPCANCPPEKKQNCSGNC